MRSIKTICLSLLIFTGLSLAAQDKYDYGTDSAECVKNLSLFNEYAKQKAYADAYPFWKQCVTLCPASRKGLYTNGEKMFKKLIKTEEDPARKTVLQDSLLMMFDMRIENFGQAGFVKGKKGVALMKYYPERMCEAKDLLAESVTALKTKASASVISNYYSALYACYETGGAELETLFNEYLVLSDYINTNIETLVPEAEGDEKKAEKLEKYITAKNNLDEYFIGFADCADIVEIFKRRIDEAPEDLELKIKALRIMNRKECTENDLFAKVTRDVHAVQPTAESAYGIARDEAGKGNYSESLKYMKEALEQCGDCAERTNYLKYAGYMAVAAKNYSYARQCANDMLKREPNSGHAYILKGDVTKASAGSCDDGELGRYGAYWVAHDYYARAKSIDKSASVQKIAGKKMASVSGAFPLTQDVFFYNKKSGDSYTSSCTGQTTTIRTRD